MMMTKKPSASFETELSMLHGIIFDYNKIFYGQTSHQIESIVSAKNQGILEAKKVIETLCTRMAESKDKNTIDRYINELCQHDASGDIKTLGLITLISKLAFTSTDNQPGTKLFSDNKGFTPLFEKA